jgi:hypothetical protein
MPGGRPPARAAVAETAEALRRLLAIVEAGELDTVTPKDVALVRRLQGALVGWEASLGQGSTADDHSK